MYNCTSYSYKKAYILWKIESCIDSPKIGLACSWASILTWIPWETYWKKTIAIWICVTTSNSEKKIYFSCDIFFYIFFRKKTLGPTKAQSPYLSSSCFFSFLTGHVVSSRLRHRLSWQPEEFQLCSDQSVGASGDGLWPAWATPLVRNG